MYKLRGIKKMEDLISIGRVQAMLGVCRQTLVRWEKEGIIVPFKNHKNWRFYSAEQVEKLKELVTPRQKSSDK